MWGSASRAVDVTKPPKLARSWLLFCLRLRDMRSIMLLSIVVTLALSKLALWATLNP
jgi:hypothetical protein